MKLCCRDFEERSGCVCVTHIGHFVKLPVPMLLSHPLCPNIEASVSTTSPFQSTRPLTCTFYPASRFLIIFFFNPSSIVIMLKPAADPAAAPFGNDAEGGKAPVRNRSPSRPQEGSLTLGEVFCPAPRVEKFSLPTIS